MGAGERFQDMPNDVRALVDAVENVLLLYMPGTQKLEMMVGRHCTAELRIVGGPITQDTLSDVMAHLAYYKKYFPKESDPQPPMSTPQGIIAKLAEEWAKHRAASTMPTVLPVLVQDAPQALAPPP